MTARPTGADAIVLPERMDMLAAQHLRDTILSSDGDLSIDASGVAVLMVPSLQVLMAGADHQRSLSRSLRIEHASPGFLASLRTLGVSADRLQTLQGGSA